MSLVVLAMSGGVDSSVAARLLLDDGHRVIGVFMRHGEQSPAACPPVGGGAKKARCCSAADAEDAHRVADRLDIPLYVLNFQREFAEIVDYFVAEYTAGRTPNPCIVCNQRLKFGKLFEYADSVGAEFVATGHYARLAPESGRDGVPGLCRGVDRNKDQSYALFGIARPRLARILLPVGRYVKGEIRQIAARCSLPVADKRESQEICFVPGGKHDQFIRNRRGGASASGEIVTTDGCVVGTHGGIERFTIGQRKGLGVALGEPRFVVRIEADTRRVVIGKREELARSELTAGRTNWLVPAPTGPIRCLAQIRYNSRATPATAEPLAGRRLKVAFDEPRHGVAPGQAVVLYRSDRVLGGGWIE